MNPPTTDQSKAARRMDGACPRLRYCSYTTLPRGATSLDRPCNIVAAKFTLS